MRIRDVAPLVIVLVGGCADDPVGATPFDATVDADATAVDATLDAFAEEPRDATVDRPRDAARDVAPTPDVASEDAIEDVVIDPGMCGASVRACLCGCGMAATCQNNCIARDDDCGFCVYVAATRCCRDESTVFDNCIDASMCTDDACIRLRCGDEQRRFETCFAAMQVSDDACRAEMRACLGSDYPMVRCVQP